MLDDVDWDDDISYVGKGVYRLCEVVEVDKVFCVEVLDFGRVYKDIL